MPDSKIFENIQFLNIIKGLIHNVNTPLNLIMGYSQQLRQKYPNEEILEKIYQASLEIDDIQNNTYRNIISRLTYRYQDISLDDWLKEEVIFINNELDIKHKCELHFNEQVDNHVNVTFSSVLLSTIFEAVILYIVHNTEENGYRIDIRAFTEHNEKGIEILVPLKVILPKKSEELLKLNNTLIKTITDNELIIGDFCNLSITSNNSYSVIKLVIADKR